jgi:hypothetical protein
MPQQQIGAPMNGGQQGNNSNNNNRNNNNGQGGSQNSGSQNGPAGRSLWGYQSTRPPINGNYAQNGSPPVNAPSSGGSGSQSYGTPNNGFSPSGFSPSGGSQGGGMYGQPPSGGGSQFGGMYGQPPSGGSQGGMMSGGCPPPPPRDGPVELSFLHHFASDMQFTNLTCNATAQEPACDDGHGRNGTWVCRSLHSPVSGTVVSLTACIDPHHALVEADTCGCCGGSCPVPCTCGCTLPGTSESGVYVVPGNGTAAGMTGENNGTAPMLQPVCVSPALANSLIADPSAFACYTGCSA